MLSVFIRLFGFVFLFLGKCAAYSAETTSNFFHYISSTETKILDLNDFYMSFFSDDTPTLLDKCEEDRKGNKYKVFVLHSSYAPGRDALYQGGGALSYYMNPHVSIKTGPSYCKDIGINTKWKWACQLNLEIPIACR